MTEWCSCNKLKEAEEKAAKWDAIVRCKDCEHWATERRFTFGCLGPRGRLNPNGFCSDGERREA